MIDALAFGGVNRASLGVQSFDPAVQRAINRVQSFEETAAATTGLRRAGISGINFDLIYGLPHQTVASCLDTVSRCVELRPDRFSVFGYAHVPAFKKHQRKIDEAVLPDSLERHRPVRGDRRCAEARPAMSRSGSITSRLPDDGMAVALREGTLRRNFQGYTTDESNVLLGFGASAIGHLPQGYVQNEVGTRAYAQAIASDRLATVKGYALTDDDRLRAEIIERIMCDFSVDLGPVCARHGSAAEAMLQSSSRLRDLISDGIVELDGTSLAVADDSRFLVRSVAAAFDAHLDAVEATAQPGGLEIEVTGARPPRRRICSGQWPLRHRGTRNYRAGVPAFGPARSWRAFRHRSGVQPLRLPPNVAARVG